MKNPSPYDYTVAQKVVHWLMALLITLDLFVAQKFGGFLEATDRLESRSDHASMGTIITLLFIWRLWLRYRNGAPELPTTMPAWQLLAARWGHRLLYVLIGFLIVSGIITAMNAANPIEPFRLFDLTIGQTDESLFDSLRVFHEFATNAVIALIVVHVVAALWHLVQRKDRSTQKMLKFWKREQPT